MRRYICRVIACAACVAFMGLLCVFAVSADSTEFGGDLSLNQWEALAAGTDDQAYLSNHMLLGTSKYTPILITNKDIADQKRIYVYATSANGAYVRDYAYSANPGQIIQLGYSVVMRYEYIATVGMANPTSIYAANGSLQLADDEYVRWFKPASLQWNWNVAITAATVPFGGWESPAWVAWSNARAAYNGSYILEEEVDSIVAEKVAAERDSWYWQGAHWQAEQDQILIQRAKDKGYEQGFREGKNEGIAAGGDVSQSYFLDIGSIISAYIDGAINFIQSILSFDLFGVNIAGVFGAIIATLILGFVVALIVKLFGLLV